MKKQGNKPPKISEYILSRMFPDNGHFTTVSDLDEDFKVQLVEKGALYAKLWYRLQILLAIPHFITGKLIRNYSMFKNYLKIAIRSLKKNKLYSGINILSLSIAFGCCVLIFSFIRDEFTYDRFHEHADEIFEIYARVFYGEHEVSLGAQAALNPTLSGQFPEIITSARIDNENLIVRSGDNTFTEKFISADPEFFEVLTFPLRSGVLGNNVLDINSLIISQTAAEKYFGTEDPMGKTLLVKLSGQFKEFTIAGILEENPGNSSIRPDFIIHIRNTMGEDLDSWNPWGCPGLVIRLEKKEQAGLLQAKFKTTIDKNLHSQGLAEKSGYHLNSFTDFHLNEQYFSAVVGNKSKKLYSYLLSGIAALVFIIAICNFVNLTVGSSSPRLKEIGLRKVFGAQRKQLIRQFWVESVILSLLAFAAGLLLAVIFLPSFNLMSQKVLDLGYLFDWKYLLLFSGLVISVGIAAGSYPALVLSGFASVDLFKRMFRFTGKNFFSRIVIVFQFVISLFFVISTLIIFEQYDYMLNSKLGIDSDNVIVLDLYNSSSNPGRNKEIFTGLKENLQTENSIISVSASQSKYNMFSARIMQDNDKNPLAVGINGIDYDYIDLFGIDLLEGRNFSRERPSDLEGKVIVNRSFVERFKVESPLGKKFSNIIKDVRGDAEIIGVVDDFHFQSMHTKIWPTYLELSEGNDFNFIYIKVRGSDIRNTLDRIKGEYNRIAPDMPFFYSFIDEEIAQQYETEKRYGSMFSFISFFAILIACSGLFGLTSLTIVRRTKEISIRKVLGASVTGIMKLINREFLILVAAGNLFAWPCAYFAARYWLQNFAYQIEISPLSFIISGIITLFIAFITISIKSGMAATINPAETLLTE
ncbi:ABC transporter permease [candidate division KSB1 bacterium]